MMEFGLVGSNPCSPGGIYMVHKKPLYLSEPGHGLKCVGYLQIIFSSVEKIF